MPHATVAYVLVSSENTEPADRVLSGLPGAVDEVTAIHLCREVPENVEPRAIPSRPSPDPSRVVVETWLASGSWLRRALDRGLDPAAASRLIVRVEWPPSVETETTLLMARLGAGSLRLAVAVPAAGAEEAFLYFNRLGFTWFATPRTIDGQWARSVSRLCRLWCVDPRSRTPVEPIQSAFAHLVAENAERPRDAWSYVVIDADSGTVTPPSPWLPSIHAALLARATTADGRRLRALADADATWSADLRALCALDVPRVKAMFAGPAAPVLAGGPR